MIHLLEQARQIMPVVVGTGARQTGKTTGVRELHREAGRTFALVPAFVYRKTEP